MITQRLTLPWTSPSHRGGLCGVLLQCLSLQYASTGMHRDIPRARTPPPPVLVITQNPFAASRGRVGAERVLPAGSAQVSDGGWIRVSRAGGRPGIIHCRQELPGMIRTWGPEPDPSWAWHRGWWVMSPMSARVREEGTSGPKPLGSPLPLQRFHQH